jgi:hypothetical protein
VLLILISIVSPAQLKMTIMIRVMLMEAIDIQALKFGEYSPIRRLIDWYWIGMVIQSIFQLHCSLISHISREQLDLPACHAFDSLCPSDAIITDDYIGIGYSDRRRMWSGTQDIIG